MFKLKRKSTAAELPENATTSSTPQTSTIPAAQTATPTAVQKPFNSGTIVSKTEARLVNGKLAFPADWIKLDEEIAQHFSTADVEEFKSHLELIEGAYKNLTNTSIRDAFSDFTRFMCNKPHLTPLAAQPHIMEHVVGNLRAAYNQTFIQKTTATKNKKMTSSEIEEGVLDGLADLGF